MAWVLVFVAIFLILLIFTLVLHFSLPSRKNLYFHKRHALVTGGSKGIGFQLAKELISRGCNISIVARNKQDLQKASEELQTFADQRAHSQKVYWYSADLTRNYEHIEAVIREAESKLGPVDILINNAGHSVQAPFAELPVTDFEAQMRVYATRAVIEKMKEKRAGHISFVSSVAGQCAIFGYSAYSPTKFALRGFADALHMELLPYKVNVSLLYPPNTETEGFKLELETMPEETMLISDSAGIFSPEDVAKAHVNDIEAGNYTTTMGLDGWMCGVLTAGAAPEKSLARAMIQFFLAGLFRGVMLCYLGYFNGIVKKCYFRRKAEQEEQRKND